MSNIEAYIGELRSKALLLRSKVENAHRLRGFDPNKCGIYELLGTILKDLDTRRITPERLRGNAFGIFRIVTDGWILEDTEIGRDVMKFRLEIRKLADMLEQSGNSER